jgi:hypothetical protein
MTRALKEAFDAASTLPEPDQDALAAAIRAEIGAEKAWENGLTASPKPLEKLADEAIAEHAAGLRSTPAGRSASRAALLSTVHR